MMLGGILFFFFFLFNQSESYTLQTDQGFGNLHILSAVKDTFVERAGKNWDKASFGHLIVGHLIHYPVKRTLIQFEDLPSSCPVDKIVWARFFMHFVYAHRASFRSVRSQPWIDYTIHVHRIKRGWYEHSTTPENRCNTCENRSWYKLRLELGRDAVPEPECIKTVIRSGQPGGRIGFDITGAMKEWASGQKNNGVLVKVDREDLSGRGLRFYDRHHKDVNMRPYAQVLCRY